MRTTFKSGEDDVTVDDKVGIFDRSHVADHVLEERVTSKRIMTKYGVSSEVN